LLIGSLCDVNIAFSLSNDKILSKNVDFNPNINQILLIVGRFYCYTASQRSNECLKDCSFRIIDFPISEKVTGY